MNLLPVLSSSSLPFFLLRSICSPLTHSFTHSFPLTLSLSARYLSVETIIVIAAFLTVNTTIHRLSLSNSGITDEGVGYLAAALRRNNTLKELDLSDSKALLLL